MFSVTFLFTIYVVGFSGGSVVKNLPVMQETRVQSLVWEDSPGSPRGGEITTHSSILAWRILWTGEPGRVQSIVLQRIGHNWATKQEQFTEKTGKWRLPASSTPNCLRISLYQAHRERIGLGDIPQYTMMNKSYEHNPLPCPHIIFHELGFRC